MKRIIFSGLILLAIVLALAACAKPAPTPTPAPAAKPTPTATTAAPTATAKPTTTATPTAKPTTTPATPAKVFKLTYALFQPTTHDMTIAHTEYAKEIEKRTNGQVQITVYPAGQLLGGPGMLQGIKGGIADMGHSTTPYNTGSWLFTEICSLPTSAPDGWVATKAAYDFILKYQPKEWNDVHMLTIHANGVAFAGTYTGKKPLLKLEDWKGAVIRSGGIQAAIVTALGGTPKDLAMADTYDAISKGAVDGVIGSPDIMKTQKLGDVCKYINLTGAGAMPSYIFYNAMNKDKWNSLPPDIQKTITDVSVEYMGKLALTDDASQVSGVEYTKSKGDSISVVSADEMKRWTPLLAPITDNYLKDLTTKGYTKAQVDDAWSYFQSRVAYWTGQMGAAKVTPLIEQLNKVATSK